MSIWIKNLKTRLEDRPVLILHGNVRDKYIDDDGRTYDNLTALLTEVAASLPLSFSELVFYDLVGQERRVITRQRHLRVEVRAVRNRTRHGNPDKTCRRPVCWRSGFAI